MKYLLVSLMVLLNTLCLQSQDTVLELEMNSSKYKTDNINDPLFCGFLDCCCFGYPQIQYESGVGVNIVQPVKGKFDFLFGVEYNKWSFNKIPLKERINITKLSILEEDVNTSNDNSHLILSVGARQNFVNHEKHKFYVENRFLISSSQFGETRKNLFGVQPSIGYIKYFGSKIGLRVSYHCKQYLNDFISPRVSVNKPFVHGFKLGINIGL